MRSIYYGIRFFEGLNVLTSLLSCRVFVVAFVFRFGGCGGDLSVRDADGIGGAGITWSSISIKQQHISTKRHIILVDGWCGLYIILSIIYIMPTRRRTRHARKSRRHARSHSRRTRHHRGGDLITAPMTTATDAINTVTTGATNAVGTAVDETKKATTSAYNTITSAFSGLFGSSSSTTPATTTTGGRRSRRRRHSRRHSRK